MRLSRFFSFFFFWQKIEMNFSASAVLCFNKGSHSSLWQLAFTKGNHCDSSRCVCLCVCVCVCVCVCACTFVFSRVQGRKSKGDKEHEREEGHLSGSVWHELFAYTIITTDAQVLMGVSEGAVSLRVSRFKQIMLSYLVLLLSQDWAKPCHIANSLLHQCG